MSSVCSRMYPQTGRSGIARKRLLWSLLLQVLCSVRSERMIMEQMEYNLLAGDSWDVESTKSYHPVVLDSSERRHSWEIQSLNH